MSSIAQSSITVVTYSRAVCTNSAKRSGISLGGRVVIWPFSSKNTGYLKVRYQYLCILDFFLGFSDWKCLTNNIWTTIMQGMDGGFYHFFQLFVQLQFISRQNRKITYILFATFHYPIKEKIILVFQLL